MLHSLFRSMLNDSRSEDQDYIRISRRHLSFLLRSLDEASSLLREQRNLQDASRVRRVCVICSSPIVNIDPSVTFWLTTGQKILYVSSSTKTAKVEVPCSRQLGYCLIEYQALVLVILTLSFTLNMKIHTWPWCRCGPVNYFLG